MSVRPPGSWVESCDRWAPFRSQIARLPPGSLVVLDIAVSRYHAAVMEAVVERGPEAVVLVQGGERAKSLAVVERIVAAGRLLHRSGTLLAVGGGSICDVAAVAAHLLKRGVRLVLVPTTFLAAVDSSIGGKGAVNLGRRGQRLKNLAGVFHYPEETWLCPELLSSIGPNQRRQGMIEAWKMLVTLDADALTRYLKGPPPLRVFVNHARGLKRSVCARDPYDQTGVRAILNFGHTIGHVLECLSRWRLPHGDAIGLGMVHALDVGRRLGVTSETVAAEVEEVLHGAAAVPPRKRSAQLFRRTSIGQLDRLLAVDKKSDGSGAVRMVLLARVGQAVTVPVPRAVWAGLWPNWRSGVRP